MCLLRRIIRRLWGGLSYAPFCPLLKCSSLVLNLAEVLISARQVIGAPSFFPTVWGWIKGWFDPITTSKIFVLGPGEVLSTLEKHVDVSDIPKKYGGELDFEFGMPPILDADVANMFEWEAPIVNKSEQTFPMGPMKWVDSPDGIKTVMAFGSQEGKPRREIVATLRHGIEKETYVDGQVLDGAKLEV